jgi:hypothetical protein
VLADGYVPDDGALLPVIRARQRSGEFSALIDGDISDPVGFAIEYLPEGVDIVVRSG